MTVNAQARAALNGLLFLSRFWQSVGSNASDSAAPHAKHSHQAAYEDAVKAIASACTDHIVGVLWTSLLLAWNVLLDSGIWEMKIPVRHVVDCHGHKLDCEFEVPLISTDIDNHQAGLAVAKLAALQVRLQNSSAALPHDQSHDSSAHAHSTNFPTSLSVGLSYLV